MRAMIVGPKDCTDYNLFKEAADKLRDKNITGLGFCELEEIDVQRPKIINSIIRALK